jgi:hypothetical protein
MKIRFLEKPAGTEYEAGQVAEFDDRDWVAMSYPQKYLREGIAEVVGDDGQPLPDPEAPADLVQQANAGGSKGGKKK